MRTTNLPDPMTRRQQPPGDALRALAKVVKQMRAAQKAYFAAKRETRGDLLPECRRLERAVDALLESLPDTGHGDPDQANLGLQEDQP